MKTIVIPKPANKAWTTCYEDDLLYVVLCLAKEAGYSHFRYENEDLNYGVFNTLENFNGFIASCKPEYNEHDELPF